MSSTVSTTEVQTVVPKSRSVTEPEDKQQQRLVRSSSIEKIKRFNTFICSQQYYLIPALLSWLKSSQSGLQSSTERTIFLFRSILFNAYFYRLYQITFRSVPVKGPKRERNEGSLTVVISNFYEKFTNCFESTFLLAVAVYFSAAVLIGQLFLCVYLIVSVAVPYGFAFMVSCMVLIKYLCYKTVAFSGCDIK